MYYTLQEKTLKAVSHFTLKVSSIRYYHHHFHTESDLRKLPRLVVEPELEL